MELWSHDDKRIFFDERHRLPGPAIISHAQQPTARIIQGKHYLTVKQDGAHWSLRITAPDPGFVDFVIDDSGHTIRQILVCAPFLLLPMWFAILRGLLPLRLLSERLLKREAEDLSPLHFDAKYGEIKPLVAALDGLLLRLHNKVKREHAFVQDAAHELRTPMAVISAQVHVLAKAASPADKMEAERYINHAIARASHLIEQLLELARVDGMRKQADQILDLTQLVRLDLAQLGAAAKAAPGAQYFSVDCA